MTSALEDIKTIDLNEWLTLATAPSPTKILPGQTPYAYNTWVDEKPGSVITANGYLKVGTLPSGKPGTFSINYFNTSAGTQIYVVSDNATVWTTVDFQTFTPIITGLSATFQLRGAVIRDKLWLTNGNDFVRVFDGTSVTVLDGSKNGSAIIQDLTYTAVTNQYSPSAITVTYIGGGTAGSEVVTVNNTTQITVQIQSGVSTGIQVTTAVNNSVAAAALVTVSGGPSIPQVVMSATPLSGGVPLAPKGTYIAYHDERVWLYQQPSARSLCSFSALTDAAANEIAPDDPSAWQSDNNLQISEGDADYGTGLLVYRGYLHFFKQYSIWRLVGFDEYSYTRVKTRASTGTRFNESLQILDSLVQLIGIDGIYVFDGEETERISDIIDPATAEQASFGFNQLQQPNQNNLFWEVTASADWNAGTVPQNLAIANAATLQAKDNSQSDFQAAPTLTNIDTTTIPNSIQLNHQGSGVGFINVALNQIASINVSNGSVIGLSVFITDGNLTNIVGGNFGPAAGNVQYTIPIPNNAPISQIIWKGLFGGNSYQVTDQNNVIIGSGALPNTTTSDFVINLSPVIASQITIQLNYSGGGFSNVQVSVTEIQVFQTPFNTIGQIVSRNLDLGDTPASLGTLFSDFVLNGEGLTFQTQSSADGITWDAPVSVVSGSSIGSVSRRYVRWIGNFTSDGNSTAILTDVWLGTLYTSMVHDTGGNIFAWGAFQSDYRLFGQTIHFYYRGSSSIAGIPSSPWNLIVPGGILDLLPTDRYVQFKIEISGYGGNNNAPVINNVTLNWVSGIAGQPQVFQNVASFPWRNRYWLSAAGVGASANNLILIRGKKTFNSPWQLKDWNILSFTRYLDNLYGTSSVDGSIFRLDTGFSKDGGPLNSIFETGDFSFKGFQINVLEIMLETQRLGPYSLFVGTSTDQGNTWVDHPIDLTLPTGGALNIWKRINQLNLTTDKIRLRFFTNDIDQPWQVHTCVVYYKLSSQRGTIGVN